MFESLSSRLGDVFDRLRRRGALGEEDVAAALREIRIALLEADVALPVVKDFVNAVRERAVGQEVLPSVTPAQMVVKIVHDHLVETLGGAGESGLNLNAVPPVVVMMVGLQGSGKTTSAAKIALRLRNRDKKQVLLASLSMLRPCDGRASLGVALWLRTGPGEPIKFVGTGEKIDALDPLHAERIAGRILDMGDGVGLVEKPAETIEQEEAEKLAATMQKGR